MHSGDGAALACLGEREAAADKAKGCAAVEEFWKAGAAYYVGGVEGNTARLEAAVERLRG